MPEGLWPGGEGSGFGEGGRGCHRGKIPTVAAPTRAGIANFLGYCNFFLDFLFVFWYNLVESERRWDYDYRCA